MLTRCCQVVTRCCQVVTRYDQMLPDGAKTVRKVFLKKGECQKKCFGVVGVGRKVFLGCPAKIKGQTLLTILPPSAAIKSEQRFWTSHHNLCPKSARILSAAITIDGWPGAWSNDLAPRRG